MSPTFTPYAAARAVLRRRTDLVLRWAVDSQARSRRNALLANSALTARRLEREEVERFLRSLRPDRITA